MKSFLLSTFAMLAVLLMLFSDCAVAQDMRSVTSSSVSVKTLESKAAAEKESASKEAGAMRGIITQNRESLMRRLQDARKRNLALKARKSALSKQATLLEQKDKELLSQLDREEEVIHELVGVVRINARDIRSLVEQNMQTALFTPDTSFMDDILQDTHFPGMDDVRRMVALLKEQISQTGWVVIRQGNFVGRDGREKQGTILLVGPFTAAYRTGDQTGFLLYSAKGKKFFALSKSLPYNLKSSLETYMKGENDAVPVDISRGAAVRDIVSTPDLWQQVEKGGPVVWPIIGVFAAGVFIILERTIFLLRRRVDSSGLLSDIHRAISRNKWEQAEEICRNAGGKPLARILLAGLEARGLGREEMENALQEAILSEIPMLERFLSALGMLAAIAPLLGLLGTVTGMINTFHVITLHGTGDPKLLSAGISEALVTTMLGLSAAIPLLMGHNILGSVVDKRISDMEEKAVALINMALRTRDNGVQD